MTGIHDIDWTHGSGTTGTLIGDRTAWGRGIAREMMRRRADYAFTELPMRKPGSLPSEVVAGGCTAGPSPPPTEAAPVSRRPQTEKTPSSRPSSLAAGSGIRDDRSGRQEREDADDHPQHESDAAQFTAPGTRDDCMRFMSPGRFDGAWIG